MSLRNRGYLIESDVEIEVSEKPGDPDFKNVKWQGWTVIVPVRDVDAFVKHLRSMHEIISYGKLDRKTYEMLCKKFGVKPVQDKELSGYYGIRHVNFSMSHYNSPKPGYRESAISGQLGQQRFFAIEREMKSKSVVSARAAMAGPVARDGQIWEPCVKCGKEPSYLPLHLCKKCWPSQ